METKIKYDPLDRFPEQKEKQLRWTCGYLLVWGIECLRNADSIRMAWLRMTELYGFPLTEMEGGQTSMDGTHISKFESDPDLYPLIEIETPYLQMFLYESGIFTFRNIKYRRSASGYGRQSGSVFAYTSRIT